MVDGLRNDKIANAQEAFQRAMSEKINAALDERKIAVAGQIYKTAYHTAIAKADAAFARDTRKADSFSADERDRARAAADRKQSKAYDRAHAEYRALQPKTESYSPIEEATAPTHQHDAAVHHDAKNTIDRVHSIMKSKGYTRKAFTTGANRDHEYTKAGHPSVTLSTWHGTGNYGAGTAVHSLYVNSAWSYVNVLGVPGSIIADKHHTNSHFTSAGVENHKKLGQEIVSHVKSL